MTHAKSQEPHIEVEGYEARTPLNRLLSLVSERGIASRSPTSGALLTVRGRYLNADLYYRVTKELIEQLEAEDSGFQVGRRFSFNDLGVLGHAIISSPTVADGISTYLSYRAAFGAVFSVTAEHDQDGGLTVTADIPQDDPDVYRYLADNWVTTWSKFRDITVGEPTLFRSVSIPVPEPAYSGQYRLLFDCPIHFSAERLQVSLRADALSRGLVYANRGVHALCVNECEFARKALNTPGNLVHFVRMRCFWAYVDFPTQVSLAADLHLSVRTLHRRLAALGTSFLQILMDVKMERAARYQQLGTLPPKEIAYLLGYRDVQNYYRAFRDYHGVPPRQYSGEPRT